MAPASVSQMVGGLLRMFAVLAPEGDWTMLARVYRHLKQTAAPSRDKISRLVAAGDLLELGIRLMETCEDGPRHRTHVATQIPRRADDRAADLLPDPAQEPDRAGDRPAPGLRRRGLRAAAHRGRDQDRPAVPGRHPDRADRLHRPLPRGRPAGIAINCTRQARPTAPAAGSGSAASGQPLGSAAIRVQIEQRTKAAFGRAVWPHLFRDCAVTELVDLAPEEIGVAADLLGHAGLQTTQKHYIHAQGMTAHARVQEVIQKARCRGARQGRERRG